MTRVDELENDLIEYGRISVDGYRYLFAEIRFLQEEVERLRGMVKADVTYLATPYSHPDPKVVEYRVWLASRITGLLMQKGHAVFCPISHSHSIVLANPEMPRFDQEYWMRFDRPFISACSKMVVPKMDGWETSKGVKMEIAIASELNKPVELIEVEEV